MIFEVKISDFEIDIRSTAFKVGLTTIGKPNWIELFWKYLNNC